MMWRLANPVKHYAWGSPTTLPDLLGKPSTDTPWAEVWCGAHASDPSVVLDPSGERTRLDAWCRRNPDLLGSASRARFGEELPHLTKLLAADSVLSLQVHPSAEQARAGFMAENDAGLPLDSPLRHYKDPHPKPEILIAQTEFRALAGWREPASLLMELHATSSTAANSIADILTAVPHTGFAPFVHYVLGSGEREALAGLAHELMQVPGAGASSAVPWLADIAQAHPGDPGLLVAWALNAVQLDPGQALYAPAGLVHAYVSGFGVEVMAASDNVVRAGLTPKRVDVAELVSLMEPHPSHPTLFSPSDGRYAPPTPYFEVFLAQTGDVVSHSEAVIVLALASSVITAGGTSLEIAAGEGAFVGSANHGRVQVAKGRAVVVTVPTDAPANAT